MTTTGAASVPAERFVALVGLLNREARLLERLVFKLTETELLTAAGETRFVGLILDEVDDAAGDLGGIEVARSMMVADLCESLGLADDASLQELSAYAPPDTAPLLAELRERLVAATLDVERVGASGSKATMERLERVTGALSRLQPGGGVAYNQFGQGASHSPVPTRFDLPA